MARAEGIGEGPGGGGVRPTPPSRIASATSSGELRVRWGSGTRTHVGWPGPRTDQLPAGLCRTVALPPAGSGGCE